MTQYIYYFYVLCFLSLVWLPFWTTQFAHAMSLREDDYPTPGDKRRWFWVFVVFFPIAPFAYLEWRGLYAKRKAEQASAIEETP